MAPAHTSTSAASKPSPWRQGLGFRVQGSHGRALGISRVRSLRRLHFALGCSCFAFTGIAFAIESQDPDRLSAFTVAGVSGGRGEAEH